MVVVAATLAFDTFIVEAGTAESLARCLLVGEFDAVHEAPEVQLQLRLAPCRVLVGRDVPGVIATKPASCGTVDVAVDRIRELLHVGRDGTLAARVEAGWAAAAAISLSPLHVNWRRHFCCSHPSSSNDFPFSAESAALVWHSNRQRTSRVAAPSIPSEHRLLGGFGGMNPASSPPKGVPPDVRAE